MEGMRPGPDKSRDRQVQDETVEAIKAGTASPTPEFAVAANEAVMADMFGDRELTKEEYAEALAIVEAMDKRVDTMNAGELDAFIGHINKLLQHVQADMKASRTPRLEDWPKIDSNKYQLEGTANDLESMRDDAMRRRKSLDA